ncbi:hypothetical protein CSKR_111093 [Clonorchis sinensis]|uniref:Uncharacterized protein n=1 Tax=Clonorchis sinensis TaxID=79923 RepID=A0A419QC19_CLOSI|nr:hypothetical protein CSKR_111093 [Clonorchis sinensis]
MDDLNRLYEHQTMMAIGIYSFLDNLLAHMPSRPEADSETATDADCPPPNAGMNNLRFRPGLGDLAGSLLGLSRPDSFRDRQERIRILPRIPTWSPRPEPVDSALNTNEEEITSDSAEPTVKIDTTPGGFPEDIFIYLSAREKEEYMCSICYSVLKEPYQCKNEHRFCYGCIYTWSTGSSAGHDGCPVCRCDGLYAKNYDLVDRINKKRTRCTQMGCNWMGILKEHEKHEHRRYSPFELDILLSDCSKQLISRPLEKLPQPEQVIQKPSEGMVIVSEQEGPAASSPTEGYDTPAVGSLPHSCVSVDSSLEEVANTDQQNMTPNGVNRLGMNTRPSPTRRQHNRRPGRTSSNSDIPPNYRTNASQSRLSNRSHQLVHNVSSRATRMPIANSTARAGNNRSTTHRTDRGDRNAGRLQPVHSNVINNSRPSVSPPCFESAGNGERAPSHLMRSHSSMEHAFNTDTRLLPLRTPTSNTSVEVTTTSHQVTQRTCPPSIMQTEIPPSPTYHAARQQLYNRRTNDALHTLDVSNAESSATNTTNGTSHFSLPAIHPGATLTARQSTRPYYEAAPAVVTSTEERNPTDSSRVSVNHPPMESRPLEFRRLVPRRSSRVVEQLRETREQLAAMLRLMTLELEERRQHVLAATLETASGGRLLRNVPSQMTDNRTTTEQSDTDTRENAQEVRRNVSDNQNRQNSNLIASLNVLRNLPTPERRGRIGHYEPLHQLTNRYLGERISGGEYVAPLLSNRFRSVESQSGVEDEDDLSSSTVASASTTENGPTATSTSRLLARLRMRSRERTSIPSVLLVTGRRSLGHLLSELRYPRASVNEWSSEEDDEDELNGL